MDETFQREAGLLLQPVAEARFDFPLGERTMSRPGRSHGDTSHDQYQKHESPELRMLVHGGLPPEAEITIYDECKNRRRSGSTTLI